MNHTESDKVYNAVFVDKKFPFLAVDSNLATNIEALIGRRLLDHHELKDILWMLADAATDEYLDAFLDSIHRS